MCIFLYAPILIIGIKDYKECEVFLMKSADDESHIEAVKLQIELLSEELVQIEANMEEEADKPDYYEYDMECWGDIYRELTRLKDELKYLTGE